MNRRTTTWVRARLSVSILVLAILRLAFFDEVGSNGRDFSPSARGGGGPSVTRSKPSA